MTEREAKPDRRPCLILHGLGGGPYELQPLTEAVAASGREVRAPVLPGHDGPGPAMPSSSWPDWTRCAEAWYDDTASETAPAAVVGFSTGAMIALHLASRRKVDRLILLAPFLAIRHTSRLPFQPVSLLRVLARWTPEIPRRGPAVRDPEMRRWASSLDRFRTFNLHAAVSALEFIEEVKPLIAAVDAPVLIVQGRLDSVVEPSGAAWLHGRLTTARSRLIELPRSDHLVALDKDRESLIDAVLAFLDEPPA
ncbi:MAG: alpha/beta fold hydrolase [Paludisphaera borealis]|uniref:alpha/beta hydrolase n=1 Tax=Paludisphaera borealis TaxID=1387353 RepID=UPI002847ABE6|nr:alpha/beta fold hydrolase [Paludisphaera borealis]MDR3621879.1 alpha/beta fold hydrolase [Paludisphaera borealis]